MKWNGKLFEEKRPEDPFNEKKLYQKVSDWIAYLGIGFLKDLAIVAIVLGIFLVLSFILF